jgi:hypothetical protein
VTLQVQQHHVQFLKPMRKQQSDALRVMSSNLGGNTSYSDRW